jgi:hypothetical protein
LFVFVFAQGVNEFMLLCRICQVLDEAATGTVIYEVFLKVQSPSADTTTEDEKKLGVKK